MARGLRRGACAAFALVLLGAPVVTTHAQVGEPTPCEVQCGPAPCCMILWYPWCGCPWGDPQQLAPSAAQQSEALMCPLAAPARFAPSDLGERPTSGS